MNVKPLRPIFIFPNVYSLPYTIIPTLEPDLENFNSRTLVRTDGHSENCVYFSFQQITPITNTLSWVNINVSPTREIIQLLAWQVDYEICWRSNIPLTENDALRFIIPNNSFIGHEPWDVFGNDIRFLGTQDRFIIPGIYGFFVIRSPNPLVQLSISITAKIPKVNKYFTGNFCLKNKHNCKFSFVYAYTNIYLDREIIRTVDPNFLQLQESIREEYLSREYNSCFPPIPPPQQVDLYPPTTMTSQTTKVLYGPQVDCSITYTSIVFLDSGVTPPGVVTPSPVQTAPGQFVIGGGADGDRLMQFDFTFQAFIPIDSLGVPLCVSNNNQVQLDLMVYNSEPDVQKWEIAQRIILTVDLEAPAIINEQVSFQFLRADSQYTFEFRLNGPLFNDPDNNAIAPDINFSGTLIEVSL